MCQWCHATDGKTGARLHELGVCTSQYLSVAADQFGDPSLVDSAIAGSDDQHSRVVGSAPENDALGDLAERDAKRIGSLLRGAGRSIQHHRTVGMLARFKQVDNALDGVGQRAQ